MCAKVNNAAELNKLQELANKAAQLFNNLIVTAWNISSLDVLYTVVRVSGIKAPGWDPFDEALNAFADYKDLIELAEKENNKPRLTRLKLLFYCHLLESSAPLDLLCNLLRIKSKKTFHMKPFVDLYRFNKKSRKVIPPSVNQKIKELEKLAKAPEDCEFLELYKSIYNDDVRNSFFHSDYCLSSNQYRWTESGFPRSIKLEKLDFLIESAFSFFKAFFHEWDQARYRLGSAQKYWKLPNYETLELIRNQKGMLIGFNVHFSNGEKATFSRNSDGSITATNLIFGNNGIVDFFVGRLNGLKEEWCADGVAINNWDMINSKSKV